MGKLTASGLAFAVAVVAVMGSSPAAAGRSESKPYGSPALGQGDTASVCVNEPPLDSCVAFTLLTGETTVHASVIDATGNPVYATIGQDLNSDGLVDISMNFCGQTSVPFTPVEPPIGVYEVVVYPHLAPGLGDGQLNPCLGVATSGVVTIHIN
jgi:hypothetical protein